jgi:serine/threonine protein phosphatase PrpC
VSRSAAGREQFSDRLQSIRVTESGEELGFEIAGLTDAGLVRRENQDALGYRVPDPADRRERGALFVVCDGIGTLSAGQAASDLALGVFFDAYYASPAEDPEQMLRRAAAHANAELLRARSSYEVGARLGTTIVSALIKGRQYYVLNVGDSRAYIRRDGDLRQVSRDHGPLYGRSASDRRISRALGLDAQVRADVFGPNPLIPGDDLLLCSDGLTTAVPEPAIGRIMGRSTPAEAAALLVERAKTAGARDNVSVLLVRILGPETRAAAEAPAAGVPWETKLRSFLRGLTWEQVNPIGALSSGRWRTPRGLLVVGLCLLCALVVGLLLGRLFGR